MYVFLCLYVYGHSCPYDCNNLMQHLGRINDASSLSSPERLLAVDVGGISCGSQHVVVVSAEGVVFTWGRGEGGRLGTGNEDDV